MSVVEVRMESDVGMVESIPNNVGRDFTIRI